MTVNSRVSKLETAFFKQMLSDMFPELIGLLCENDFLTLEDLYGLIGGVKRIGSDTDQAIKNIEKHITSLPVGRKKRIVFCPAGGLYKEALHSEHIAEAEIIGFIDKNKASAFNRFEGYPLYGLESLSSHRFDSMVLLSSAYADEIYDDILKVVGKSVPRIFTPFLKSTFEKEACGREISVINELISSSEDAVSVVFAVEALAITFLRRIEKLRQKGIKTILMCANDTVSGVFPLSMASDCFDHVYCANNNYLSYFYILKHIRPSLVHTIPVVKHYLFGVLVQALCRAPVVCEFNDVLSCMYTLASLADIDGAHEAEIQFACEGILCSAADGILYKNSHQVVDVLTSRYDVQAPSMQFQAYVYPDQIREKKSEIAPPYHMVYAGGIFPSDDTCSSDSNKISLSRTIDILTEQGIYFSVYNSAHSASGIYKHYENRAAENPRFSYHLPVPTEHLIDSLTQYDFGWHSLDIRNGLVLSDRYATIMTHKFFDYLSAGLPVIVMEDQNYLADLVQRWGIGICITYDQMYILKTIIARYDFSCMLENVRKAQRDWSIERHMDRLIKFYKSVMTNHQTCGFKKHDFGYL